MKTADEGIQLHFHVDHGVFNAIHCCYACLLDVMKHYVARTKLMSLTHELPEL